MTFDFVSRGDKNELGFSAVTGVELGSDKVTQGKWLVVPVFEEEEGFPGGSNPDDGSTTDGKKYPQYGAANPKKPNPKPVATILKFAVEARSLRNKPGSVARMKNVGFWQTGTTFVSDEQKNGPLSETAVFVEMLEMLGSIRGYAEGMAATSGKTDRGSIPGGDGFFVTPRLVPAGEKNNAEPKTKTATTFDPLGSLRLALVERGYGPPPSATTLTSSRGSSVMPTRAELRKRELYSLEKTIADLGGFEKVAASLGWAETRRKPRGYWADTSNLKNEVLAFIETNDLQVGEMPSRPMFEEKGRFDIARAVSKSGGAGAIAPKLGLREPKRRNSKASKK